MGSVQQAKRFQEKRRLAREQEAKRIAQEKQRQAQLKKLSADERQKLRAEQAKTIQAEMLRLKTKQREAGRSKSSIKELRARRLSLSLQLQEAQRTGKILDLAKVEAIAKAKEQQRAREVKRAPARKLERARLKEAQKISKLDENRAKDILREVARTGEITREQSKKFQALGFDERQLTKAAVEKIAEKKLEKPKVKAVPKITPKLKKEVIDKKLTQKQKQFFSKLVPEIEKIRKVKVKKLKQDLAIKRIKLQKGLNILKRKQRETIKNVQPGSSILKGLEEGIAETEVALKLLAPIGKEIKEFDSKNFLKDLGKDIKKIDVKKIVREKLEDLGKDIKKIDVKELTIKQQKEITKAITKPREVKVIKKLETIGRTVNNPKKFLKEVQLKGNRKFNNLNSRVAGNSLKVADLSIKADRLFKNWYEAEVKPNPLKFVSKILVQELVGELLVGAFALPLGSIDDSVRIATSQADEIDNLIKRYDDAGVSARDRTPLGTERRNLEKAKKQLDNLDNTVKTEVNKIETSKNPKKQVRNSAKKIKQEVNKVKTKTNKLKPKKKTKAQLKAELAKFESERLAKTTKAPKLKKADDVKRFIDINKKNTAKLENLLEDNFGTANFKKYRKLVEQKTGKKVLVRQTKLKQVKVRGAKARVQTRTKVNIVDKKSPKIQLKKGESIKRIDAGDNIFIENLDEVKKASKEIDFQFNQGRIDDINRAVNKWDKKGSLQLVNKNKRKNFVRKLKSRTNREVNDVKQIYRESRERFRKASKKIRELSSKRREKTLTSNQAKQFSKARIDLKKAIKGLSKSQDDLRKLRIALRILPKLARKLAIGLAAKEISALGIDQAIDNANDQLKALEKATAQELKEAQEQEQKLDQPLKPKPKPSPKKKTTGAKTTVVKKVVKPVKKVTPKLRVKKLIKKPIKEPTPKKIPLPRLSFDSSRLKDKVALFIGKYRERQNPRKPFNKRTNKVVQKTLRIKDTKNRALKRVSDLADTKAIRSIDIKLVGITTTKKKDIGSPKVLNKFRTTKSKLKDRLNLVEKAKHTLDKKTERRELASLKKRKKVTTKKKKKVVNKKRKL